MLDRVQRLSRNETYLDEQEKIRRSETGRSIDNLLKDETSGDDEEDET